MGKVLVVSEAVVDFQGLLQGADVGDCRLPGRAAQHLLERGVVVDLGDLAADPAKAKSVAGLD